MMLTISVQSSQTTEVNFRVEAVTGHLMTDWTLASSNSSCSTSEDDGACKLALKDNIQFSVLGSNDDEEFQDLNIIGFASASKGAKDLTTFMGKRKQLVMILKSLGIEYDPKLGVTVVGLDISTDGSNEPNTLTAAVGASALMSRGGDSAISFIYDPAPSLGSAIVDGGSSFITFANVNVGSIEVEVTAPSSDMVCELGPSGVGSGEAVTVESLADVVTVVSYICSKK